MFLGKVPEHPSPKEKIMFWKTYRGYIKKEINRMRHVAVSQFKQLFFKGKDNVCIIFNNSGNNLNFNNQSITYIEYIKTFSSIKKGEKADNDFSKLITFCKSKGDTFGDNLLQYKDIDMGILTSYFNVAMCGSVTIRFKERMVYQKFSDAVTVSEEALAMLIFENAFQRWIHMADMQLKKLYNERSDGINKDKEHESNKKNEGNNKDNDDDFEIDELGNNIPNVLYQRNVQHKKNKVHTAGKWLDKGIKRYNEMLMVVKQNRNSSWRNKFEKNLQDVYIKLADENMDKYMRKRNKSQEQLKSKKVKVQAINMFDEMELK